MEEDNQKNQPEISQQTSEKIVPRLIEDEMKQSYVDYAMSVIVGRALPDARDGLKPVHRRILFAMHDMGMFHNKPFKKSARIVGEVLGKYHPHGDMAVYDALVRMAQNFSLRYPLINGQGNWGSVDGDSAAAMRYTEARLNRLAEEMLQDIDKKTVKFVPNFDESLEEPSLLPSKVPNLLINGSSGIAVGMATNIPPHNMGEVVDGTIAQINNPDLTIKELMQYINGPDFPTGALICGKNGIINAYSTGKGHITVRAKTSIEEVKDHKNIIISEIPYMVNKSELVTEIANLVRDKKVYGIADIRDESDREGMRIVIELRKDANYKFILNHLYKHTRAQNTFGVIMLALVDNEPKVLNLKELIKCYIDHRRDVVRKRTEFDLQRAQQRAHILEGIIIALDNIDLAIKLIKESKSAEEAKTALINNFKLTDEQALATLDLKLQKLASLEQEKIRQEHSDLLKLIEELKSILASEQKILEIIKKELLELKERYGNARKSEITSIETTELAMEDLVKPGDMVITISHSGYIKRLPVETYKQQRRGGKGVIAAGTKEEDFIEDLFIANTHSYILFFTNKGRVYWLKVFYIPEAGRQARGKAIINLLNLQNDEKVTAFVPVDKFDEQHYLIMATKKGTVKKTDLMAYSNPRKTGIIAITLDPDDELIGVMLTDGNQQIILATKNGMASRFEESKVRPTGRSAMGVKGITLREDDVMGIVVASDEKTLLTLTENGYGKRTSVSDYRLTNRGGIGVRNIICSERNGKAIAIKSTTDEDDVMFISQKGNIIRIPAKGVSVIGRNTQGVRLIRLEEGDKAVSIAKIVKEEGNEDEEEPTEKPEEELENEHQEERLEEIEDKTEEEPKEIENKEEPTPEIEDKTAQELIDESENLNNDKE
ncbi:DNA gyrase subunit A [Candidatus Woesearchaeota archaeon]|nr:DNA gyrase subunit A [Candidatus Woesearchaeota archaeon]